MEEKTKVSQWLILVLSGVVLIVGYYFVSKNFDGLISSILENLISTVITVLFTWIFLNFMLTKREKLKQAKRLNTLLGVFYDEFGNELLNEFVEADEYARCLVRKSRIEKEWSDIRFNKLKEEFETYDYHISGKLVDFKKINKIIGDSHSFIIDALFTQIVQTSGELGEILFDVIHIRDEINDLDDIENIKENELEHMEEDVERLYRRLTVNWVEYMKYLNQYYPELFTKALKKSPYEKNNKK